MLLELQAFFAQGIGAIIKALFLLILALIVSAIAQNLVKKILGIGKISDSLAKADPDGGGKNISNFIGRFVHLLVFLLFVPGIFSALGAQSISEPILNALNTIWGYVPNILAAAIIVIVGQFIAQMVRQLLIPLFKKLNIDGIQERAGIRTRGQAKLSYVLSYAIYVLILVPVTIIALQALGIRSISEPAIGMLQAVFGFIPRIFVAFLIFMLGYVISGICAQIVKDLLSASGIDARMNRLTEKRVNGLVFSSVISTIIKVTLVIFFAVQAVSVLQLTVLTEIGKTVISYMPRLLASILIAFVCVFASGIAEKNLRKADLAAYGLIVKCVIYVFGVFMILSQLQIASDIVNSAFIIILAGLAVAFALAFGIGGRDFAAHMLKKLEDKIKGGR